MNVRRLLGVVHRDTGYFLAGLTVMYAVSGIAVNHIGDWNPNYSITRDVVAIGELPAGDIPAVGRLVRERLSIGEEPRAVVPAGPGKVRVFFENRTITVDVEQGQATDERVSRRAVFYHLNFLHLNRPKGIWTWIADVYAVGLVVLVFTGIFIVKGRAGLRGRGLLWMIAGLVPPLLVLWWKS
jgi:uncharacterized protein